MSKFDDRIIVKNNPEYDIKIDRLLETGDPYIICNLLKKTRGMVLGESIMPKLKDAIMKTGMIDHIYEFLFMAVNMALENQKDNSGKIIFDRETRDAFEAKIRESGNAKFMCYSMGFVSGIDLEKMLNALYETKNPVYIKTLSTDDEYAGVMNNVRSISPDYQQRLEEAIDNVAGYFPSSLSEFETEKNDIRSLKSKVLNSRNPYYITELANYLELLRQYRREDFSEKDLDIKPLTEMQAKIGDQMNLYEYLSSCPSVKDKMPLMKKITSPKYIKYTKEYVPGLTDKDKGYLDDKLSETKESQLRT